MATKKTGKAPQSRVLTGAELLGGNRDFKMLEIPELTTDGVVGVVYLKTLPAGAVLDFIDKAEGAERNDAMLGLIALAVVDADGNHLFSKEQASHLRNLDVQVFSRLTTAVVGMVKYGPDKEDEETGKA